MNSIDPARRRSIAELLAVVAAGGCHVATELGTSLGVSRAYNVTVCGIFLCYVTWRVGRDRALLRSWGFRTDNLRRALLAYASFVAVAGIVIHAAGAMLGEESGLSAPALALYLAWGLAQQFALQNLLARNLAPITVKTWPSCALASMLFAASHFPRLELACIAGVGGFAFITLYRRFPNLFAAGAAHGVVGWMLFGLWGLE